MELQSLLTPWLGATLRHVPVGVDVDVLDFRFAGRYGNNRWNTKGQPTVYLAGDEGVLIAEWGRHFDINRPVGVEEEAVVRSVYRLSLSLDSVLDLRRADVWEALSLQNAPHCFLDFSVARAAANYVRATTEAQAVLVPSAGFLDQLERWCLVLFLEKLPGPSRFVTSVTSLGATPIGLIIAKAF